MGHQQKQAAAMSLCRSTKLQGQNILQRHVNRSFIHRCLLAWREPAWRSRKLMHKYTNRVLYLSSQRFWRAKLFRHVFDIWLRSKPPSLPPPPPPPSAPMLPYCPVCNFTRPPGLDGYVSVIRQWQ